MKEYASNLLHPTKGIDIPRPFPVKTYKGFYSGQLMLNSDYRDVMFQIKPDPFNFMRIIENSPTVQAGTGSLPTVDFAEAGADDRGNAVMPGACDLFFSYPANAPLANGTSLPNEHFVVTSATGSLSASSFVALVSDNFRYDYASGWRACTITGTNFRFALTNTSQGAITYAPFWFTRSGAGVVTPLTALTPQTLAAGSTDDWLSPITTTSVSGDTLLGFGIRVTNVANNGWGFENMVMSLSAVNISGNADHVSERILSLGQVSYPSDPVNAERLDQLFANCQLYAPVACSVVLNVTQQLKDRGGNFLSAYLPSRVSLPSVPERAWEVAKAYGRSYPVATNPFAKGAHGSWVGQRIQDYEFRRPFQEQVWAQANYDSLPSVYLIAQRAISAESSTATYYLDFNVAFSVQTLDPTISLSITPSCPEFCILYLSLVAMHPLLVGENPDHFKRIAELAKMVANDPRTAQLLKFGLTKILPALVSAVA